MDISFINLALKLALVSPIDNRHRLFAIVCMGGNIIAMAHNLRNRHAEERALNIPWGSKLNGAVVYIARPLYDRNLKVGMARPCDDCMKKLKKKGVKKIVYTMQGGGVGWERL